MAQPPPQKAKQKRIRIIKFKIKLMLRALMLKEDSYRKVRDILNNLLDSHLLELALIFFSINKYNERMNELTGVFQRLWTPFNTGKIISPLFKIPWQPSFINPPKIPPLPPVIKSLPNKPQETVPPRPSFKCKRCQDTTTCFFCHGAGVTYQNSLGMAISPTSSPFPLDLVICPYCEGTGKCSCVTNRRSRPPGGPVEAREAMIKELKELGIQKKEKTEEDKSREEAKKGKKEKDSDVAYYT